MEKEVAVREQAGALSTGNEFSVEKSMEEIEPRLPQIGIVHQGQLFVMPDEEKVTDFEGVILDVNKANAYWEKSFSESGGGTPPDCSSVNGLTADDNVEDCPASDRQCIGCPMNKFGSAGRGKACKNLKRVHILLEGHQLPLRLTLPPTSIKAFDLYVSLVGSLGHPYQMVKTGFSLKESQNKEGIKYSEIVLTVNEIINDEKKIERLRSMYRGWKPIMRGQPIEMDEYY